MVTAVAVVVVVMVIVVAIAFGNALQEVVKKMNSIQPYPYFKNGQHFLRPRHGGVSLLCLCRVSANTYS